MFYVLNFCLFYVLCFILYVLCLFCNVLLCLMSYFLCLVSWSYVLCLLSYVLCLMSYVLCPTSYVLCLMSYVYVGPAWFINLLDASCLTRVNLSCIQDTEDTRFMQPWHYCTLQKGWRPVICFSKIGKYQIPNRTILAQTNQIYDEVKYNFVLLLQIIANIYLVLEQLSTQYT